MKIKLILVLIASMVSFLALAKDVQTVGVGSGQTKEDATQTALRNALENVYGVYLSSTTTLSGDQILNDDITSVSFGRILTYKVIETTYDNQDGYMVTVNATVSLDKFAAFIGEKTGKSISFDGTGWEQQFKLDMLNKKNEEKAAKNIVDAVLALDIDLTPDFVIEEIKNIPVSSLGYEECSGAGHYYRKNFMGELEEYDRNQCIKLSVKRVKENPNVKELTQFINNSFKALKGPKAKTFQNESTQRYLNALLKYVEERSHAFAITDGTESYYPINHLPVEILSQLGPGNEYNDYRLSQLEKYNKGIVGTFIYNGKLGYNSYYSFRPFKGKQLKEVNIFYTPDQLGKVKKFTVIPISNSTLEYLKDNCKVRCSPDVLKRKWHFRIY